MDKWTRSEPKGHPAGLIIEQKQETTWVRISKYHCFCVVYNMQIALNHVKCLVLELTLPLESRKNWSVLIESTLIKPFNLTKH